MPPYTAVITTEVLSNQTRRASYYDTAHARDEGGYSMRKLVLNVLTSLYSLQAGLFACKI
jgi:hypothetical protein